MKGKIVVHKHRIILLLILFVAIIMMPNLGCSCNGYNTEVCLHENIIEFGNIKNPTCTEFGYSKRGKKCARCGEIIKEQQVSPALGHEFIDGRCIRENCNQKYNIPVTSVEVLDQNDNVIESMDCLLFQDFNFNLKINNKIYDKYYCPFHIDYQFSESEYLTQECIPEIDYNRFAVDSFLGNLTLSIFVEGKNKFRLDIPFTVELNVADYEINYIEVASNGELKEYYEDQSFNRNDIFVWGNITNKSEDNSEKVRILDFNIVTQTEKLSLSQNTVVVTYSKYSTELSAEYPINVIQKSLKSIEILTSPDNTEYVEGQLFDSTGLVVIANFEYSSYRITDYRIEYVGQLLESMTTIKISYTYNGVTKYAEQSIKVNPKVVSSVNIDYSLVQRQYTVGDIFDITGLVYKVVYEYIGEVEIFDYEYSTEPLTLDTTQVEIKKDFGTKTETCIIPIMVKNPYEQIANLKIILDSNTNEEIHVSPYDVDIMWSYTYTNSSGDIITNNTDYLNNGLTYDRNNGIYDIPVGSILSIIIKNPAFTRLKLNGEEKNIDPDSRTISFKVIRTQDIEVELIEISGQHSFIRFLGDTNSNVKNKQFFVYTGLWNNHLRDEDITRLSAVFMDNDNFYYSYLVKGNTLLLDDLKDEYLYDKMNIVVAKNTKKDNSKEVVLHLHNDISYSIYISADDESWYVPETFTRPGYLFDGWSSELNGETLSQNEIKALIESERTIINLYIIWKEEIVDYSHYYLVNENNELVITESLDELDCLLIGNWNTIIEVDNLIYNLSLCLNSDGTFSYITKLDTETLCSYIGKYRIIGNAFNIIYSEPINYTLPYLTNEYFNLQIDGNNLMINFIMIDDGTVNTEPFKIQK